MGQISSDLPKKALATWQHAFLSSSTTFYNIFAQVCAEIKISRFSFCYLFVAVIERLLGLLPVQKFLRKNNCSRQAIFTTKSLSVVAGNFVTSFSLKFLSIFVHWARHPDLGISGKIFSSCRTWVHMMTILVTGDNVRGGTKANTHQGRLHPAQESKG